jgi:hypothetical protein
MIQDVSSKHVGHVEYDISLSLALSYPERRRNNNVQGAMAIVFGNAMDI